MNQEEKDLVTILREWWNKRGQSTPADEKAFAEKMQGTIEEKAQTMPKVEPKPKPEIKPVVKPNIPKRTRGEKKSG